MMPDLHTALEAAIRARLEVARAVAEQVGRVWRAAYYSTMDEWRVRDRATQAPIADVIGGINAAAELVTDYAVLHDPDDAIRRYERDLSELERHWPTPVRTNIDPQMAACAYEWADGDGYVVPWEFCWTTKSLLDVYPEVTR